MRASWICGAGAACVVLALATLGAAQPTGASVASPEAAQGPDPDPWINLNRRLYGVDQVLDRRLIRPGVVFYHHATPTQVRHGVGNVIGNLTNPVIFFNDLLQLRPAAAGRTLLRLVVNSTVGIGGLFDVAADSGVPHHAADFGQTLGRYGVGAGPYVYLPVLGPTTVRDLVGRGVDTLADPLNTVRYDGREVLTPVRTVVGAINDRDQVDPLLESIHATATDPYVTIRSLYLQNRAALVNGSAPTAATVRSLPDFGPEPSPAGPAPKS